MACLDVAAKERLAALCQLEKIPVLWDEPMKNHTSFKIGGPAAALCAPKDRQQLRELVGFVQREGVDSWYIGNGSNLLVSDKGLNGIAILLDGGFDREIEVDGTVLLAPAGKKLSAVCAAACAAGLTGLEFAYGIPGSVGGAVYMNAGAYGGEMKDRLLWVEYLAPTGEIVRLEQEQLSLSYRHSRFMEEGMQGSCIVRAAFGLQRGEKAAIQSEMDRILNQRRQKQPLEYPSAGSTFKRPQGAFAAQLIDKCGLKGFTVGGAQVSEKHAGFVINTGKATCADVLELTRQVRECVQEKTGYLLELEVRQLP